MKIMSMIVASLTIIILSTLFWVNGMIVVAPSANAESMSRNYESNSAVGFYGEYQIPEEVNPPVFPEQNGTGPSIMLPEGSSNQGGISVGNEKFPQTGDKKSDFISFGIFLLVGTFVSWIKNISMKRRELI